MDWGTKLLPLGLNLPVERDLAQLVAGVLLFWRTTLAKAVPYSG